MSGSNSHNTLAEVLLNAGNLAIEGRAKEGEQLVQRHWPHVPRVRRNRSASTLQKIRIFKRDHFCCRYSGDYLFLPAYLVTLSTLWPSIFPAHRNGKAELAHDAYWTHIASLEHVDPIATGGRDSDENWITTSMARNQVRSRYPLETLEWTILPISQCPEWDGGLRNFMKLIDLYPNLLAHPNWGSYLTRWRKAVLKCEAVQPGNNGP